MMKNGRDLRRGRLLFEMVPKRGLEPAGFGLMRQYVEFMNDLSLRGIPWLVDMT